MTEFEKNGVVDLDWADAEDKDKGQEKIDLEHTPLLVAIFFLLLLLLHYYIISKLIRKQRKSPENLPPSPPKLPLIGHLHLLLSGGLLHHVLRGLAKKHGPVFHLQLGEILWVVVSSPETTKQLMKTQDPACADKAERLGTKLISYDYSDIIFSPYGPHWRQMRRIIVSELLNAPNLRCFGLIRQDETSRLVLSLQSSGGQAVDLSKKVSTMTRSIICRAAFGSVVRDGDVLMDTVKKGSIMATGMDLADLFPSSKFLDLISFNRYKLRRMHRRLDAIIEGIMQDHKLEKNKSEFFGGEDIIGVLRRMQDDTHLQVPITNDAIKGFIFDTIAAGTESSSNTIIWAMGELMRNPGVMAKAQAEVREALKGKTGIDVSEVAEQLTYLKSVVKETLRLHPPLPLILRQCREECRVNGYRVPVKSRIAINVWSLGRDPLYWEEPEVFRPERFHDVSREFLGNDFEFIPFGAGRRICPALVFGQANVEVPLAQLLYHFNWRSPQPQGINTDMVEAGGYTGARKNPLFLLPIPYLPSN